MPKVTIHDVAARAGVSISTVSRVFNNNDKVDPELARKVLSAATQLNYRSINNPVLSRHSNRQLAFVAPSIDNTYFSTIISGAITTAQEMGYNMVVMTTNSDPEIEKKCLEQLSDGSYAGILFSSFIGNDPLELCPELENIPVVIAARRNVSEKLVHVAIDNEEAGYTATKYLLRLNHRNIALFANFWDKSVTTHEDFMQLFNSPSSGGYTAFDRYRGYRRALEEEGIEYDPDLLFYTGYTYEDGYADAQKFLSTNKSFDAIICPNDRVAAGIMRLFREQGIAVPEQVSIICLNGGLTSKVVTPALTVTSQPNYTLGCRAVQVLVDQIEGKPVNNEILGVQLLIQGSTAQK